MNFLTNQERTLPFTTLLSETCNATELRYVRDMKLSIITRKTKQAAGALIERRSGHNVKENLIKDIYILYSFGECSVQSLEKYGQI